MFGAQRGATLQIVIDQPVLEHEVRHLRTVRHREQWAIAPSIRREIGRIGDAMPHCFR
jgi:hypothetical protein